MARLQLRSAVDGLVTEQGLKSLEKLKLTQGMHERSTVSLSILIMFLDENTSTSRRLKDLLDEAWATDEAPNITSAVKDLVGADPLPLQYVNAWRPKRVAFLDTLRSMLGNVQLAGLPFSCLLTMK